MSFLPRLGRACHVSSKIGTLAHFRHPRVVSLTASSSSSPSLLSSPFSSSSIQALSRRSNVSIHNNNQTSNTYTSPSSSSTTRSTVASFTTTTQQHQEQQQQQEQQEEEETTVLSTEGRKSVGWVAPKGNTDNLPFKVARSVPGRNLPVYTDFRKGRTQRITILRKCSGDMEVLKGELAKVLGGCEVVERPGRLEVKGFHSEPIKKWLLELGF
eukprot:TRINITY_DN263_c5_g5_i1.p1 TRINITY_DN263_c5_g5~~TRINITY_DN263_c5_g5_i1.p1  ORF type:complete len:213 (+),score=70.75 TRINITY_DN263_c5_g5_i1:146-784(+)